MNLHSLIVFSITITSSTSLNSQISSNTRLYQQLNNFSKDSLLPFKISQRKTTHEGSNLLANLTLKLLLIYYLLLYRKSSYALWQILKLLNERKDFYIVIFPSVFKCDLYIFIRHKTAKCLSVTDITIISFYLMLVIWKQQDTLVL